MSDINCTVLYTFSGMLSPTALSSRVFSSSMHSRPRRACCAGTEKKQHHNVRYIFYLGRCTMIALDSTPDHLKSFREYGCFRQYGTRVLKIEKKKLCKCPGNLHLNNNRGNISRLGGNKQQLCTGTHTESSVCTTSVADPGS